MLKIDALDRVRVLSVDDQPRMNDDGSYKTNRDYPGAKQWPVTVRYPERVLTFADGSEETDYAEQRVSVWAETRPQVEEGSHVCLTGVRIGAYPSGKGANLFIWCSGMEPVDNSSTTSSLGRSLGDDDDE